MSVVTKSKKPYVALYTADHSTQRTPQMQVHVFEAKRQTQERDYVDIDNYWDEMNINSTGTVCAMMSLANVTSHKRNLDCPMMCLTTPFYILDRENRTSGGNGPTGNHHPYVTIDHADTIKFIAGLVNSMSYSVYMYIVCVSVVGFVHACNSYQLGVK